MKYVSIVDQLLGAVIGITAAGGSSSHTMHLRSIQERLPRLTGAAAIYRPKTSSAAGMRHCYRSSNYQERSTGVLWSLQWTVSHCSAMKRTVVWLTEQQIKDLGRMSKRSLAPISALVREAVKDFLRRKRPGRKAAKR